MNIVDRRLNPKGRSHTNRQRFIRLVRENIKEAVVRSIKERQLGDVDTKEVVNIPRKRIQEPRFHHSSQGGNREHVHPGNKEFVQGDTLPKPEGGGAGGRSREGSPDGEGEDDFTFALSKEEFMQVFFEDLALPNMVRTQLAETPEWKSQRAGFTADGTPNNLHVVRSMRGAIGRRIAIGSGSRRELRELEERLSLLKRHRDATDAVKEREIHELEEQIKVLQAKLGRIPYLDPIDLRFRNRIKVPVPTTKAVMFCLMDVSGSMDEARKDLAKRFFILLYLFLTRHYERIDLVFIRHHTQAQEVDEENFFHARETGGTVVSSALVLMEEIIRARYSPSEWNIYGAQASDGDNWHHDSGRCRELLSDKLLPLVRYFAYVQVAEEEQNLWEEYSQLAEHHPQFAMRKATEASQIYPVFRDLFKKEGAAVAA
jgi:uncharacterized sporulation protein YeaH/YhbH (DUF444 family)